MVAPLPVRTTDTSESIDMTQTCFDLQIDDRIAHLRMTRPEKRNSMIPEFWEELPRLIHDIDHNARARVIVISSTGPHFTGGLDIGAFMEGTETGPQGVKAVLGDGAAFMAKLERMQETFSCLENARLPVIVAVQGGCIGGGVDLTTACDLRFATADAFFVIQEINIGMTADVGTFPRLCRLLPEGIVRELAYTGRRMSADEALHHGLVNRVLPDHDALLKSVNEVAAQIATKAPLAVFGSKRMINYTRDHTTADSLDYIRVWNASMLQPEDMIEAMAANVEQRSAEFSELPKISDNTIGREPFP